jgi:hypothetical protein
MVLMAAIAVASNAQAEDEDELYYEKESSTYAVLNGSASYFDGDNDFSGGVGLVVGGQLSPHFSMEAQYDWQADESTHLASYNLRYIILTDSIQPWIKAGIGLMGGRTGHPFLFMGRFSAGADFFLTEQWAVAPSLSYAVASHDNNVLLGSLGVVYYFE